MSRQLLAASATLAYKNWLQASKIPSVIVLHGVSKNCAWVVSNSQLEPFLVEGLT